MSRLSDSYSADAYGKISSSAVDEAALTVDGRSSNKMNEGYNLVNAHNAYASEEEWALEINDTLGLGNWFDTSGAPRDPAAAAVTGASAVPVSFAAAAPTKAEPKSSIHHGPSSRRIKKKKGMPKRPLSAYNIFFQKERVRIYEQSSGRVSFEDLGKTIGQRWKSLSEEDRREYDELAEAEVARYRVERDAYDEMRRKNLECKGSIDDELDESGKSDTVPPQSWMTDTTETSSDSLKPFHKESASGQSFKRAPYYFKPHDPDAPLPYTSLPPGMLVSLRDPDGREQSYKIEYKCFRMTRKDAEEYMDRLNEQMETGQVTA